MNRIVVWALVFICIVNAYGNSTSAQPYQWPPTFAEMEYRYTVAIRKLTHRYDELLKEKDAAISVRKELEGITDEDELEAHLHALGHALSLEVCGTSMSR